MTSPISIRLAFREEGTFWNAYLALPGTMEGAKLMGSIGMGAVRKNQELKDQFMKLMQQALADAVQELTGEEITEWKTFLAPEAERAGHS
jgi:hypothetical protein